MVKRALTYQFWRSTHEGPRQTPGREPVHRPPNAPLYLPRARLTRKQRQAVINWYWGPNSDHRQPLNTVGAVAAQLKVSHDI